MHRTIDLLLPTRRSQHLDIRTLSSPTATEYYLTLTPSGRGTPAGQANELYAAIASHLRETGAFIAQERLFADPAALPALLDARTRHLLDLDDGVLPTLLSPAPLAPGQIIGLQLHAIHGPRRPSLFRHRETPFARAFHHNDIHYLTASALSSPRAGSPATQTRCTLESAHALLQTAGASLHDLARTWLWMDNILSWYDDLNSVRTTFFQEHGLMLSPSSPSSLILPRSSFSSTMPASTGIGVSPQSRRVAARGPSPKLSLDLFAAWTSPRSPSPVERFHALGNQRSAYEYGSAFSRAARVRTPAGQTIFCSGTAAIDPAGKTCHPDNPAAQIAMTLDNVRAILHDLHCSPDTDVLQAMAYCATPQTLHLFQSRFAPSLPWPLLTMPGTVCRQDLLFELELTASPNTRRPA